MTEVKLNSSEFRARFPDFKGVSNETLEGLFITLESILGDGEGHFPYRPNQAKHIVYLALAHLVASHQNATSAIGAGGIVSSVSQGSVSASYQQLPANTANEYFWLSTLYGREFWLASAPYRRVPKLYNFKKPHPYG
jgi:hypothetical protein